MTVTDRLARPRFRNVIIVRNWFAHLAYPTPARLLGSTTAAALSYLVFGWGWSKVADALPLQGQLTFAATSIAAVLGWLLAHRAVSPGWSAALSAAGTLAFVAVLVGSFAVAAQIAVPDHDLGSVVGLTLGAGVVGVALLGVPLLAVELVVALAWVGTLRALLFLLAARDRARA